MDSALASVTLIVAIFLFAGAVKGLIGVGLPTVAVALLINLMPLSEALPLIVLPAMMTNVWQAHAGGAGRALLRRLWPLFLLLACGTWLGVEVLTTSDQTLMAMIFGTVLASYALLGLSRPIPPPPGRVEPWLSPAVGLVNGLINGLTGSYIVPGTLYLQALGLSREELVQAMGILFLVASTSLGVSLAGHDAMSLSQAAASAAALIPAMLGYAIGQHYRQRLPEERFRAIFLIGLLCLGVYTVIANLVSA